MLVFRAPRSAETPRPSPKTSSPRSAVQIIATFIVVPFRRKRSPTIGADASLCRRVRRRPFVSSTGAGVQGRAALPVAEVGDRGLVAEAHLEPLLEDAVVGRELSRDVRVLEQEAVRVLEVDRLRPLVVD